MVSLGLSSGEHWKEAQLLAARNLFPMDNGVVCDQDIRCAAKFMALNADRLHDARSNCYKPVCALSARMQGLTSHLPKFQRGTVAKVGGNINLGLFAIAVVLTGWPDWRLPMR